MGVKSYPESLQNAVATTAATGLVPLTARALSGQTANVFQALASDGTPLAGVSPGGTVQALGGFRLQGTVFVPVDAPAGTLALNTTTMRPMVKTSDSALTFAPVGAQKAQGTYTGTGATYRAVTVGFEPDLVLVNSASTNTGMAILHRTETAALQTFTPSSGYASPGSYLTTTGFNTGGSAALTSINGNGGTYYWTAFKFV